jgi:poly(3-hydroxybutyrate) depolymerase
MLLGAVLLHLLASMVLADNVYTGSSEFTVFVNGTRPATVYVPASYVQSSAAPLILLLHGYTNSVDDTTKNFGPELQGLGHIIVAPSGTKYIFSFWNAGFCCGPGASEDGGVDDEAYLLGLIDAVKASPLVKIDPKRVYVVGYSNVGSGFYQGVFCFFFLIFFPWCFSVRGQ